MPTYAYACKDCGHAFDIVQSFSDSSLTECPSCGGSLRKKFSSVGVVFKGSGFYRTDSRSSASVGAGEGSGEAGSSSGSSSSGSSDSGGGSSSDSGGGSSSGSAGGSSGSGKNTTTPASSSAGS